MHLRVLLLVLLLFSSFVNNKEFKENKENTDAKSYIVLEQKSKTIIEGKDIYYTQSVASISKIMTAILAIENLELKNKIYVDNIIESSYGSSVYLKKGTWITTQDLLYGLMLRSGNDCALVLAKAISKSIDNFVILMNSKAKEINMKNTIFNNPHGLDEIDGGNISCSYDMALLQSYALDNEIYRKITSTKSYKSEDYGLWVNKNKILKQYNLATSGKTGYTKKAKRTLVTSAKLNDLEVIIVTINCGQDFAFHKKVYEKTFDEYENILVLKKGKNVLLDYEFIVDEDIYYFAKKEELEQSKLYLEILKNNKVKIYVINGSSKELIYETTYIKQEKELNFLEKIFKYLGL